MPTDVKENLKKFEISKYIPAEVTSNLVKKFQKRPGFNIVYSKNNREKWHILKSQLQKKSWLKNFDLSCFGYLKYQKISW